MSERKRKRDREREMKVKDTGIEKIRGGGGTQILIEQ